MNSQPGTGDGLGFELGDPKAEARSLLRLVGRNGDTIETVRELIGVSPRTERLLLAYGRKHPEDEPGILRILKFRQQVANEFEKLASNPAANRPRG